MSNRRGADRARSASATRRSRVLLALMVPMLMVPAVEGLAETAPLPAPVVRVSASASPSSARLGASFTYVIEVSATGRGTARDVNVIDAIPAGLGVDAVTGPNCSVVGRLVTCGLGDLVAGASALITIEVTVNDRACPAVRNVTHVQWTAPRQTPTDDRDVVATDLDCGSGSGRDDDD